MPIFINIYDSYNWEKMVNVSHIQSYSIKDTLIYMEIDNKMYHKKFIDTTYRDLYIKKYLETNDSNESFDKLEKQIEKMNENIEEIRDMIKYQPGSQVCMESKEDFDIKKNDS